MSLADFDRLLEAALPAAGLTTLTLTEVPAHRDELLRLLERAIVVGNQRGAPLAEIQASFVDYPDLPDMFWHVPVEDSSREGVLRLAFAPRLSDAA